MNYEPKPGDLINDVTKGPIVTPSKEDVNNRYVTPLHASWYRDGKLMEGFDEVEIPAKEPKEGFPVGEEAFSKYSPKQREFIKRYNKEMDEWEQQKPAAVKKNPKKSQKPAAKRGSAKKPFTAAKQTMRRSK